MQKQIVVGAVYLFALVVGCSSQKLKQARHDYAIASDNAALMESAMDLKWPHEMDEQKVLATMLRDSLKKERTQLPSNEPNPAGQEDLKLLNRAQINQEAMARLRQTEALCSQEVSLIANREDLSGSPSECHQRVADDTRKYFPAFAK